MRLVSTALAVAVLLGAPAHATAFAGVKLAFWQAEFAYYSDPVSGAPLTELPPGVVLECTGSASAVGSGCGDRQGISVTSDGPPAFGVIDALGGFTLRNDSSIEYAGDFVFRTTYSAFNPGGPEIGASVDDPAHEFASFFSVVSGPGVFDLHGCTMNHGSAPGASAPGASCGVSSPDDSDGDAVLGPLLSGQTLSAAYEIYIQVFAKGGDPLRTPEPLTLGLFLAGLLVLRRFRAA